MPHINRIRVNNVKYNFGTQYYDDFVLRFSGKNTIYDLANGGGKSVLMLLLLQNLIPNCTLDEKQPIEKLFRSGNGNTTIHSMIEWKLNPCHVKNGFQYMTTGFCARKARGTSEEETGAAADRAAIDYFNYCIFYRQFNDNDLKNLPLSNGKERITYLGLRSYLQELEKKDFHVEVKIFDRKGEYQSFISQYGLFESEWEIIRGINKTEGHVRTYFETNYRTTRKVVEDLLIEEIIEKSFYHKTGTDREGGGMADTLLDLKEQLILLSKKKSEIHYYDRQIELLSEFAARMGSLQGMYSQKQGLEEQLAKTYHTTLQRRHQKERAHEELTERGKQLEVRKEQIASCIDAAEIKKKEWELQKLEAETEIKEAAIEENGAVSEKKKSRLEELECDNYFLNYLEAERDYCTAKQAVEEILNGNDHLEEDLFAMANEWRDYVEQEEKELAEAVLELQETLALLEEGQADFEKKEKEQAVTLQVLEHETAQLEQEKREIQARIADISREENLPLFTEVLGQRKKAEAIGEELKKKRGQTMISLEEGRKELFGTEIENKAGQKEERRITAELEQLGKELKEYSGLKERMEQLLSIYGGTAASVENVIFQQQKELVMLHEKHMEEKRSCQAKLRAMADGIFVPQPQEVSSYVEEIVRYYDEYAMSGYDYLQSLEAEERELLQERYPQLVYAVVTGADLEQIASDRKLQEKDFGSGLVPLIQKAALEQQRDLQDETAMVFVGKRPGKEQCKETLAALEAYFEKEYEKERVLRQDYNFVQMYLKECEICEPKQEQYDGLKRRWKELMLEREELSARIRELNQREAFLTEELEELEAAIGENQRQLQSLRTLESLEERLQALEQSCKEKSELKEAVSAAYAQLCSECRLRQEEFENISRSLEAKRQQLKRVMDSREHFRRYISDKIYPASGLDRKELEAAFLGKKAAYEQKNTDISDKQKLMDSFERAMGLQAEQLQLRGRAMDEMAEKQKAQGCVHTDTEALLILKKEVFELENNVILLQKEKNALDLRRHQLMGSIQHARALAEEKYGEICFPQIEAEQLDLYVRSEKQHLRELAAETGEGEKKLRQLEEQCYALKAMAQEMERMMKSAGISPENITEVLETGSSLKEQYEQLRQAYEEIVKEEGKRLESIEKEKQQLMTTLEKMGAYELAEEIRKNIQLPENEQQIKDHMEALRAVTDCLELEKDRIGKDMDSLQSLKDQFETQCLQNCLNIKEELDRLQKLSKISMDRQMISMITLQVPYIKEELYASAMSEYIDRIIREVEVFQNQAEQLSFIRGRLAFKKLFSVIVTNMDAIRLTLYKRERMKEQSRYLKYEEAVGSTGQSQGIYIQFLVAIINYISSINSKNADPLELKKVIFIDNPFGAAKDVYIWEPIFKLLKANNVQLIVPARGATPAITGHFEVNYILGQKLIDGRQQTVVVDYRSQTEEQEMEYAALSYEQESLQFT